MSINIKSLLKRKRWEGAEVGKALVSSIIHDIRYQNKEGYKPLFSQADYDKMESSLITDRDRERYGVYRALYDGIIDQFNKMQATQQQFNHGYYRYLFFIQDIATSEASWYSFENVPYVMTEEQYEAIKTKVEATTRSHKETFTTLFFALLSFFTTSEATPEEIKKAIEATKKEAMENEAVLASCSKIWGLGYYQLADGSRSDAMTDEEWKERVQGEAINLNAGSHEKIKRARALLWEGLEAVKERHHKSTGEPLPKSEEKGIMHALTAYIDYGEQTLRDNLLNKTKPIHKALQGIDNLIMEGTAAIAKWHDATNPPAGLTKYDFLLSASGFYEDRAGGLKAFKEDFPKIFSMVSAYIKANVPQAKALRANQYKKEFITWGELADLGIDPYPKLIEADEFSIAENFEYEEGRTSEVMLRKKRLFKNGMIVTKKNKTLPIKNGVYNDKINHMIHCATMNGIDFFDTPAMRKEVKRIKNNFLIPAIRHLYAYNALSNILGSVYDLPDFGAVRANVESIESRITDMNEEIYLINSYFYGYEEERARKRKLLKEIFEAIDCESLKPSQTAIDELKQYLSRLGLTAETRKELRDFDKLIVKLTQKEA